MHFFQWVLYTGIPIVPSRKDTTTLYAEEVRFDKNWILVKAVNKDRSAAYWIIDKNFEVDLTNCDSISCDSTIQAHVLGPFSIDRLTEKKLELNINLNF
jgi:hypothetical protein